MEIPDLISTVRVLEEENSQLSLEIEKTENPHHLMDLLREKEYSHLYYPYIDEVVVIK